MTVELFAATNAMRCRKMCQSQKHTDVVFVVTDDDKDDKSQAGADHEFHAHRVVCSARSPMMDAMLSSKMLEQSEGRVAVKGMTVDTFSQLLEFMYRGQADIVVPLNDSITMDPEHPEKLDQLEALLLVADQYQISDLVMVCIDRLMGSLTDHNFAKRFVFLADRLKHTDLAKRMLQWIGLGGGKLRLKTMLESPFSTVLQKEHVLQIVKHCLQ